MPFFFWPRLLTKRTYNVTATFLVINTFQSCYSGILWDETMVCLHHTISISIRDVFIGSFVENAEKLDFQFWA